MQASTDGPLSGRAAMVDGRTSGHRPSTVVHNTVTCGDVGGNPPNLRKRDRHVIAPRGPRSARPSPFFPREGGRGAE